MAIFRLPLPRRPFFIVVRKFQTAPEEGSPGTYDLALVAYQNGRATVA